MNSRRRPKLDPAIHYVRLDKLRVFEITEAELESLERGGSDPIFLNLAIAVLSVAVSFSVTLATTNIDSDRVYYVFVIFTTIGYLAGLTFIFLWWNSRKSVKKVSETIRSRIPPEGIQEVSIEVLEEK